MPDELTDVGYRGSVTYPPMIVSCAVCGCDLAFTLKNFWKYGRNKKSNLAEEDNLKITKFVEEHKEELSKYPVRGFIDYYCPECKTPIRIYHQIWYGGRGTTGCIVHYVVE